MTNEFVKPLKIAVVGDSMIDEDYEVEANRVSPEFPIPILASKTDLPTASYPGGAANVLYQLINFNTNGIRPTLVTLLDKEAKDILEKNGIEEKHLCCIVEEKYKIPRKKRFYNGEFPLCRWDIEKNFSDPKATKVLYETLKLQIKPDIVILSDYNKGFFNENTNLWLNNDWVTIVDPKKGPLEKWMGCDIFKPNFKEAIELTGTTDWKEQIRIIKEKTKCKVVVITNGDSYYASDENNTWASQHYSQYAKYPIGAGDCFIAALAMGYKQRTIKDAIEFAYNIGSAYVKTKKRSISIKEFYGKIIEPDDLYNIIKNSNDRFVFTNGCFDLLHSKHIELLKFAKSKGNKLIVALNSDESIKRLKGAERPIMPLKERLAVMEAIDCVDFVTYFEEDTPLEIIKKIKPQSIVKGGDYIINEVVGYNEVNGDVFIFPYEQGISTTKFLTKK